MVSRGAAQKEEARQIAPGCSSIRSGFWNTLCPPLHPLAKLKRPSVAFRY